MFAVEEWLRQCIVSIDCHDEADTAGEHSSEAPDDSYKAEHPDVFLVEVAVDVRVNRHLR